MTQRSFFRLYSWNVNGMRAIAKKGFFDWLRKARADVVAIQETRAHADQLVDAIRQPPRWKTGFVSAERKGYSGVGVYCRQNPHFVKAKLGLEFDHEGRLQILRIGELMIANVYFPNGSGRDRDNARVPFKLAFYKRLFEYLEPFRQSGEKILVVGDFNTAHQEIDLARPKQNRKTSGFLKCERQELHRWMSSGWLDTFRHFHEGPDQYSWWSQRYGVREKNIGWRIDYILASESVRPYLIDARIHNKVMGSDHCPISVDLRNGVWDAQA